jgi:hypothetical protein
MRRPGRAWLTMNHLAHFHALARRGALDGDENAPRSGGGGAIVDDVQAERGNEGRNGRGVAAISVAGASRPRPASSIVEERNILSPNGKAGFVTCAKHVRARMRKRFLKPS